MERLPRLHEESDDPHNDCAIKTVYFWENGMAMVFCSHGRQMPCLQGESVLARPIIAARLLLQPGVLVTVTDNAVWPR